MAVAHLEMVCMAPQRGIPLEALCAVVLRDGGGLAVRLDECMAFGHCSSAEATRRQRAALAGGRNGGWRAKGSKSCVLGRIRGEGIHMVGAASRGFPAVWLHHSSVLGQHQEALRGCWPLCLPSRRMPRTSPSAVCQRAASVPQRTVCIQTQSAVQTHQSRWATRNPPG